MVVVRIALFALGLFTALLPAAAARAETPAIDPWSAAAIAEEAPVDLRDMSRVEVEIPRPRTGEELRVAVRPGGWGGTWVRASIHW
jgi:hypothetical protein